MLKKTNKYAIWSINELLKAPLTIPAYQRPYKWTSKNIMELLLDIQKAIEEAGKYPHFKYRVGTVILHKAKQSEVYEVVDGQQRLLSFYLLQHYLTPRFQFGLESTFFSDTTTQTNLHDNYAIIREWFASAGETLKSVFQKAMHDTLEVVVLIVNELSEAFQLFDSQNSRGRALYPHDLLKAYHLREIHDKYDMQRAVMKWESKNPKAIRELFDDYLFPLWNWSKLRKAGRFTASEIDLYKGIEVDTGYTYAYRAYKAMPYFQLTDSFVSGRDFFEMVDHYMQMLQYIKQELVDNSDLITVKKLLIEDKTSADKIKTPAELDQACKSPSVGMNYARRLFLCALLCYYDRFHNFAPMVVKKLFTWAMMLRVDMDHLGMDTINRYAIGRGDTDKYSNVLPVISLITLARRHTEIAGLSLHLSRPQGQAKSSKWQELYNKLLRLNSYVRDDNRAEGA